MRILIAEDDALILSTLEFRLKKEGYEIITAIDGREALKKIEEYRPDLIISDIMMPYVSGLEIIGTVKEKYKDEMAIIILTTMGQEEVVLEAFELGADDFISKPFSPSELSIRIKRFSLRKK